ncbi:MAG: ACP S-malonyltransferase [Planctomycetes bacterium]|nr:ACP S-malonyltransferase [Planctomycetota bacterium]
MGRELADACPEASAIFARANAALGFDLARLCFEGPAEELNRTSLCQPAILTVSVAALEAWRARGTCPEGVPSAGLSLGEYTAHVYTGAFAFEDAVRLVHQRGQFMEEAGRENPGGMVAVMGCNRERLNDALEGAREFGVAEIANLNCPGQVVVSGSVTAMDWLARNVRNFGAERAIRLKVSGAFHSRLMAPASDKLSRALAEAAIYPPHAPVVSNVTGKFVTFATDIRSLLVRQLTSPVLWEDSVRFLLAGGIQRFVEVGPGAVLKGLLAKIDELVKCCTLQAPADLEMVDSFLGA